MKSEKSDDSSHKPLRVSLDELSTYERLSGLYGISEILIQRGRIIVVDDAKL